MNYELAAFWMSVAGTLSWVVCFVWMGRISVSQNKLLAQIKEQGQRVERLSKMEHDLIKQVHPQVGEIKENLEEMKTTAKATADEMRAAVKASKTDSDN